ncbi:MAG: matrixin family metalloprotease, partial [Thermoleophilaceae bacterium]
MLALSGPAQAASPPAINRAEEIAYTVYPAVAQTCPQGVVIEEGPTVIPGAIAEAWPPPYCRVRFATLALSWDELCLATVHEFGHLAGLDHSVDPNDVMFEYGAHHPACGPTVEQVSEMRYTVRRPRHAARRAC